MNHSAIVSEAILRTFESPTGGVVGLVDDLLASCPKHGLRLAWEAERCWVFLASENGREMSFVVQLRKSVLRAILARFAALCNGRMSNAVSPYGGEGTFSPATEPTKTFRVKFVNTPAEQSLELRSEATVPAVA